LALFRVILLSAADDFMKDLFRSDRGHYLRVRDVIASLGTDPFQGKPLKHALKGKYSLRIGIYRIIYSIDRKIITVYVLDVGHRRDVYHA
jgi:mRNA interferase RelE/StbE